jgi:hypothetical protein
MNNGGSLSVFWLKIGHWNRYLDVGSSKPVRFLRQVGYGSPFQKISRISSHRSRVGLTVRTLCLTFPAVCGFVFDFPAFTRNNAAHFVGTDIEMRWQEETSFENRKASGILSVCGLLTWEQREANKRTPLLFRFDERWRASTNTVDRWTLP